MARTSIYYRQSGSLVTTTLTVHDFLLEKATENLKRTGHFIVRFYPLKTKKPDPKRFVVKEYRGRVLLTGLTQKQAQSALEQLRSKKRLVISKAKPEKPTYAFNRIAFIQKCKKAKVRYRDLGIRSGLSGNYVSQMLKRHHRPSMVTLERKIILDYQLWQTKI